MPAYRRFASCGAMPGHIRHSAGESLLSILPDERVPTTERSGKQRSAKDNLSKEVSGRDSSGREGPGKPLPDSKTEQPPVIRRAEVVAFALVALLIICIVAVLYAAKAFFLPVMMAFVVGTMLAPAARWLEQHRIPRAVSAVMIVAAACALVTFIVGLIASPVIEWSARLPELGSLMKDKLHVFDRPLWLWQQMQLSLGGSESLPGTSFQLPKIEWVQPTVEFLSPTFAEFLLFLVTLILFIASWSDLRRALVMTFGDRESRLRTLRIVNAIEENLGSYLLMVTLINLGVGVATGIICAVTGMPNPAALGALAATLNFIPIIGPVFMFAILAVVGVVAFPTLAGGLLAPALFAGMTFLEGHFLTPVIVGRRLQLNALAVFIALAFWTWLWGPMGAFLASPILIVALIIKVHLLPDDSPQLPGH